METLLLKETLAPPPAPVEEILKSRVAKAWWYMAVRHQMALFSIAKTTPSVNGILKIY